MAPVGTTGWALLGELDKLVPLSAQRIASIADSVDSPYTARLIGAPYEIVTISVANTLVVPLQSLSATCTLDAKGAGMVAVTKTGKWECITEY